MEAPDPVHGYRWTCSSRIRDQCGMGITGSAGWERRLWRLANIYQPVELQQQLLSLVGSAAQQLPAPRNGRLNTGRGCPHPDYCGHPPNFLADRSLGLAVRFTNARRLPHPYALPSAPGNNSHCGLPTLYTHSPSLVRNLHHPPAAFPSSSK